jgi:hypothetical protein
VTVTASYIHSSFSQQEAARRAIVRLVFVVFLLLVFEGALRKWVLPELQRPLYFVRDPFVLLIYAYALIYGLVARSPMLGILALFAIPVSALYLVLTFFGVGHPLAWALGVRHYFFYIPLAFIIGHCLRFEDLAALIRLNLLIAIPIAVLVFLQQQSPPSAAVNRALAESLDTFVGLPGDVLRPYGTFTYSGGHVWYTAASVAMLAVAWLVRPEMRLPFRLLLPGTGAIVVMALTTGSRAIWFFLAHTTLCLIAVALSTGHSHHRLRVLGFVMLGALGVIVLYASVLEPAYEAMLLRQERAVQSEGSTLLRALGTVTHAFELVRAAPVQGMGLGSGMQGAVAATIGNRAAALAEGEWDDIVLELGPFLGLGFIALRVVLVVWLLWRALTANRLFANPAGLLLFSFAGLHLLNGSVTRSGTGSIFAWLFVGLLLAGTNAWPRRPSAARV